MNSHTFEEFLMNANINSLQKDNSKEKYNIVQLVNILNRNLIMHNDKIIIITAALTRQPYTHIQKVIMRNIIFPMDITSIQSFFDNGCNTQNLDLQQLIDLLDDKKKYYEILPIDGPKRQSLNTQNNNPKIVSEYKPPKSMLQEIYGISKQSLNDPILIGTPSYFDD